MPNTKTDTIPVKKIIDSSSRGNCGVSAFQAQICFGKLEQGTCPCVSRLTVRNNPLPMRA